MSEENDVMTGHKRPSTPDDEVKHLIASGRLGEAVLSAESALQKNPDGRTAAAVLYQLSRARSMQGDWVKTEDAVAKGMELINGSNPAADPIRAGLLERRAFVHFRQGKLAEAREEAESARQSLTVDDNDSSVLADLHNTLGGIAWWEGMRDEAVAHLREAVDGYDRAGDQRGKANALMNFGILLYAAGRWNDAASKFEESDELRRRCGFLPGRAANLLNLGVLRMSMGDLVHARTAFEESRKLSLEAGEDFDAARAEIGLAQVALQEDRLEDADDRLQAALAKKHCLCDDDTIQAEWLKALVESGRGGGETAFELASQALHRARKASLPETQADSCIAVGIAAARCGRLVDAQAALTEAAEIAERLHDPYRRALALVELSDVCDRADGATWKSQGCAHANEAARLFSGLGVATGAARAEALRLRLEA